MTRRRLLPPALVACLLLLVLAAPASACPARHWVASWAASPGSGEAPGFSDQTLRQVVTPHLGGDRLRIRLSNRFGTRPVRVSAATVARRAQGAGLEPGTVVAVTFEGRLSLTLPAGHDAVSDAVDLPFAAFDDLAVSLAIEGESGPATEHLVGQQTSYVGERGAGNQTGDVSGAAFVGGRTTTRRSFLTGIDVRAAGDVAAVVAFGDSLTDGYLGSRSPLKPNSDGIDVNGRYPDLLQRRLLDTPGAPRLSVVNAGITGNRVLGEGAIPQHGPAAVARLRADALELAGVRHVIALAGINDVGGQAADADAVIAGLASLVAQAHAADRRILLGTIPPTLGAVSESYGDARARTARRAINRWIRDGADADGVVDFDAALRDPAEPERLDPRLDSGDGLHPNLAGYRAMADAVDLDLLREPACTCARRVTVRIPARLRAHARGATVTVDGRRAGTIRHARGRVRLRLDGGADARVRVRVRVLLDGGRTATVTRRLRVCR